MLTLQVHIKLGNQKKQKMRNDYYMMTNVEAFKNLVAAVLGESVASEILGKTMADAIEYAAEQGLGKQAGIADIIKKKLAERSIELQSITDERTALNDGAGYRHNLYLKSINLSNATILYSYVFQNCISLESIDAPKVATLYDNVFNSCVSLKNINLPNVTDFNTGTFVFSNCISLESIDLPKVTLLYNYAFNGCVSLKNVNLPNVTTIKDNVFQDCYLLENIDLPKVTSMGSYVFQDCYLLSDVNLPNATAVKDYAFQNCYLLSDVNLPAVTSIASYAFQNCISLKSVKLSASSVVTLSNSNALSQTLIAAGEGCVYVPDDLVESYKTATNWSTYANQIRPISECEV